MSTLTDIILEVLKDPYIAKLLTVGAGAAIVSGIAWALRFVGLGIPVWLTTVVDVILNRAVPRIIMALEQEYKVEPAKEAKAKGIEFKPAPDLNVRLEAKAIEAIKAKVPLPVKVAAAVAGVGKELGDEAIRQRIKECIHFDNKLRPAPPTAADMKAAFGN